MADANALYKRIHPKFVAEQPSRLIHSDHAWTLVGAEMIANAIIMAGCVVAEAVINGVE